MHRLNLGSGPQRADGWTNADRDLTDVDAVDSNADFVDGPLPYDDNTFDYAVAHHALQMVSYVALPHVLAECARVLKPGGVLRVSVPDLFGALDAYMRGDVRWFPIVDTAERSIGGKFSAYATWYGEARTIFTPAWLCELCVRHGFAQTAVVAPGVTILGSDGICELDSRPKESIYVEAQK